MSEPREMSDGTIAYRTRFHKDLNGFENKVTEQDLFATLTSLYEEEFTTEKMSRNFVETDEQFWGVFGSLVSKGVFEETGEGRYKITDYGETLAEAVKTESNLKSTATPEGYLPSGIGEINVLLEPDQEPEDQGYTAEGLVGYGKEI